MADRVRPKITIALTQELPASELEVETMRALWREGLERPGQEVDIEEIKRRARQGLHSDC